MRRIVITGLIVFSALTLSWIGGAFGQRERGVAAATTRTPTQVEVTNFPAVQTVAGAVNVGNLPAVQNVAGTVQVANLPAVQSVSGTVAVNNLPFDANGNLRVTPAASDAPTFQVVKLVEAALVTAGGDTLRSTTFPIAGWRAAYAFARVVTSPGAYNQICPTPIFEEGTEDLFADVGGFSSGQSCLPPGYTATTVVPVPIMGPEVRVRISASGQTGTTATVDVWLFVTQTK